MKSRPNSSGAAICPIWKEAVWNVTAFVVWDRGITLGSMAGLAELPSMFTIPVIPVTVNIIHGARIPFHDARVNSAIEMKETDWVNTINFFRLMISANKPP